MGIRLKARKRPNIKPATNMRKVIPVIRVARFIAFKKLFQFSFRRSIDKTSARKTPTAAPSVGVSKPT